MIRKASRTQRAWLGAAIAATLATGPGDLVVATTQVIEGGQIVVDYQGSGTLRYSVDGGPWTQVPLDTNGRGQVTAPVGSQVVTFSDLAAHKPAEAAVEVVSTGSCPGDTP